MSVRDISTPLGVMRLSEEQGYLCSAEFTEEKSSFHDCSDVLSKAEKQILAYFAGERKSFDLPLSIVGSEFERLVIRRLLDIPYGQTRSYAQIAEEIGRPKAARAVGRACSRNKLLIVIPCHRVIASGGKLTGYAAGIERKLALLQLEARCIEE